MSSQEFQTCLSCGARLEPDAKACQVCGTEVSHDEFLAEPVLKTDVRQKPGSSLSAFQKGMSVALLVVLVIGATSFGVSRMMMTPVRESPPADHGLEAAQMQPDEMKRQQEEMMAQSHALLQNVKDSLKADPDNPKLILRLAGLYYDIKNFKEAEPYYSRYLSRFTPKDGNARVDYGYVLFSNGMQQEGIGELKKVLKDEPNHGFALFNLGIMYYELKDIPEARVWFEKCAANAPDEKLKGMAKQILSELDTKKIL